jgi:hypothetical protein
MTIETRNDRHAGLADELAPYIGKYAPRVWSAYPLEVTAIQQFCGAVEDTNPVYWEPEVAKASRFGRVIAPPNGLMSFNIDAWWLPEHLQKKVDQAREGAPENTIRSILADHGFTTVTVVEREEEYLGPFGPEDGHMGRDRRVTAVSPVKQTKVGPGVFMTYEIEYYTQNNERLVAVARNVTLIYDGTGGAA